MFQNGRLRTLRTVAGSGSTLGTEGIELIELPQSFDEKDLVRARSRYVEFVLDGIGRAAEFSKRLGQEPVVGDEEFVSRFQSGLERAASPIRCQRGIGSHVRK